MNAVSDTDSPPQVPASAEEKDLRARRLETAARYLYANLLPVPLVVVGLAVLLSHWHGAVELTVWAALTIAAWAVTIATLHFFLKDETRVERATRWTILICVALFVSSSALGSVSILFW